MKISENNLIPIKSHLSDFDRLRWGGWKAFNDSKMFRHVRYQLFKDIYQKINTPQLFLSREIRGDIKTENKMETLPHHSIYYGEVRRITPKPF